MPVYLGLLVNASIHPAETITSLVGCIALDLRKIGTGNRIPVHKAYCAGPIFAVGISSAVGGGEWYVLGGQARDGVPW